MLCPSLRLSAKHHGGRADELERIVDIHDAAVCAIAEHGCKRGIVQAAGHEAPRHQFDAVCDIAIRRKVDERLPLAACRPHLRDAQQARERHRQEVE